MNLDVSQTNNKIGWRDEKKHARRTRCTLVETISFSLVWPATWETSAQSAVQVKEDLKDHLRFPDPDIFQFVRESEDFTFNTRELGRKIIPFIVLTREEGKGAFLVQDKLVIDKVPYTFDSTYPYTITEQQKQESTWQPFGEMKTGSRPQTTKIN